MSDGSIGRGDGQSHILGGPKTVGSGYGDKPSLPTRLRCFDPLMGPARAGEYLPGAAAIPLTQAEASLLNSHHRLIPVGAVPPNAEQLGAFIANIDPNRNRTFHHFMSGDQGRVWALRALMHADLGANSQLGIGLHDIAGAFGSPGASNWDLVATLTRWARIHPGVRDCLDAATQTLLDEGRVPRNAETTP